MKCKLRAKDCFGKCGIITEFEKTIIIKSLVNKKTLVVSNSA